MNELSMVKHLSKNDIIKNGSIFTPPHITNIVKKLVSPLLNTNSVIMDFGAGYGAFVSEFIDTNIKIIATDIDSISCEYLKNEFQNITVINENSLLNCLRSKYELFNEDIIVVGNPPYNDITSQYKKGQKGSISMDEDLVARDLGVSFMRMYAKLKAKYICILHPLAYLIKKTNFNSLKQFAKNYVLKDATIFSSKEFESLSKSSSEFPVVAALYEQNPNGMDFEYIQNFSFNILNSTKKFVLINIKTIDGIIPKYPTKNKPDNCLQFYTIRDINALKRNTTFLDGYCANGLEVSINNLYQYSWLAIFKSLFNPKENKYLYGNLSPLYSSKIEDKFYKNQLVSYTYLNYDLIKKYFSKEEIEKTYGKINEKIKESDLLLLVESTYIF